jgi:CubicO group peptidase (beta-lactamase class C family)
MHAKSILCVILISLLLTGCFGQPQQIIQVDPLRQPSGIWPTQKWQVSSLQEQGLDPELFTEMKSYIEKNRINLHSLLVVRNGYLVFEEYYDSYTQNRIHNQYSVTKSVAATLTGIAVDQGYIAGVDERIVNLLPDRTISNVDRRKPAITLEHVLMMSSGIDWQEGDPSFNALYRSNDWVQHMLEKPMMAEPGSSFLYCSGCSHLLTSVLAEKTGQSVQKFADENLFKPLGIRNYQWDQDSQGIPVGGWGLHLMPRDMAKIGFLYLMEGHWDGKQIVSADWIEQSTSRRIQAHTNMGYGYQWWIYPDHGAYTALGRYGQTIFVIPDLAMVIVTTAQVDNHDIIFQLIDGFIVPAVTEEGF